MIISGTFFSGLDADLLSQSGLRFVTADVCREELLEVTAQKFDRFGSQTKKVAIKAVEKSLIDIHIIAWDQYFQQFEKARSLITGENDQKVLAAALHVDPDHFVTGDQHFQKNEILKLLPVKSTRKVLEELNLLKN